MAYIVVVDVAGEDSCLQSVAGAIAPFEGIVELGVLLHGDDRPEYLLAAHLHVEVRVEKNRRVKQCTLAVSAAGELCASGNGFVDTTLLRALVVLADERGHLGAVVEWVSDAQILGLGDQEIREILGDRLVDVDTLDRDAGLSCVVETSGDNAADRRLPVRLGLDDHRCAVTELESDAFLPALA